MFRLVLIIGVACAVVIAVALAIDPLAGAIVLAAEVVLGAILIWRGARGSEAHEAVVAAGDDGVHRVLVVANETVGGQALLSELRERCAGRESEILVVVPALTASALEHWSSDVDGAIAEAQKRLDASLAAMDGAGLRARGQVGDHQDPDASIEDALREFAADELVISTHPPEKSRWLEGGVVENARENVPLPVTHVIVDLEAEAEAAASSA
jgi:GABA permease